MMRFSAGNWWRGKYTGSRQRKKKQDEEEVKITTNETYSQ
jgi:hypothetical protein